MAWTDKRVDTLKKLWLEGLSASRIAARLGEGVTRNAVIGKAHRLGLAARPSPVKVESAKPAAKPVRTAPAEKPQRVTLLNLTERMCKWPIGHPGDPDFHFCGRRSLPGQPYCAHHASMAYQTPAPRRDRRNRPSGGG